jgi:hypothetical protein
MFLVKVFTEGKKVVSKAFLFKRKVCMRFPYFAPTPIVYMLHHDA